ncbi:GNAT family N-acetyltransferase [Paenibacillus sp. MBLB4367]|uniref:GNAT family N-acetyltransferase n=1 Tax=Paenibacillus sp. MBLB4367 TaxID=3384767 RepID=UPI003907EE8F
MIRQAGIQDAEQVIPLLHSAIGSIACSLAGTMDEPEALHILKEFYKQPGNRISYENVIVDERDGRIAGMLVAYHGSEAESLDQPFLERIRRVKGIANYTIEKESRVEDYYLDAVAVHEDYQGKGIAKMLMKAFEAKAEALGYPTVGLIVEEHNERAHAIYVKQGYRTEGELTVYGHRYLRMTKPTGGGSR